MKQNILKFPLRGANSTLVTISENHFRGCEISVRRGRRLSFRLNKRYDYWYTFIAKPLIPATRSTYADVASVCVCRPLLQLNFYVHGGATTDDSITRGANYYRIDSEFDRVPNAYFHVESCLPIDVIVSPRILLCPQT